MRLHAALTRGVEVPFTAEGRRKALTNARLLCKSLRSVAGNCVVTRVSLSEARGTRRSGAGLLNARAQLTVHADPAEIDRKTLEATLARLTPMLMY
ncbi:MAG: hypothetical protein EP318_08360 [Rhodobacteraceae bacterium]|nr:MAG: hypothetical protein EP318_08360 [Paracoccaceae bacterium]